MYTEDEIASGNEHPTLGPEYFAARNAVERYTKHFQEEHLKPLAEEIGKAVQEKVWDDFRDWLLADTESNLQSSMRHMVEATVNQLLGGHKRQLDRYVLTDYGDGEKIREAIAKLIPDEVAAKRIEDLEKENARLRESLRWR